MKFFLRIITNTISGNIADRMKTFLDEFCNNIDAINYSIIKSLKPCNNRVEIDGQLPIELKVKVGKREVHNLLNCCLQPISAAFGIGGASSPLLSLAREVSAKLWTL